MRATGKFLTCVCHCEDSWKNLTPVHSVPSMYTAQEYWSSIIYSSELFGEFYLPRSGTGCDCLGEQMSRAIPSMHCFSISLSFSFFLPNRITRIKIRDLWRILLVCRIFVDAPYSSVFFLLWHNWWWARGKHRLLVDTTEGDKPDVE